MTNCLPNKPLKVYVYGSDGMAANYSKTIVSKNESLIELVSNPDDACLKVVACDIFSPWKEKEPFWNQSSTAKLPAMEKDIWKKDKKWNP